LLWKRKKENINQMSNTWKQINTAPLNERIIVLYANEVIGTIIFDDADDRKYSKATHWIPIPVIQKTYNYR
jgi:hypothetical protein